MKKLYIAEKPSVAQEFAKALKIRAARKDGYLEGEEAVVTWCVGHLVTMSYPEVYDVSYKKWSLATLPFLPENFLYEVIPATKKQFKVVSTLLNRKDIDVIYVCTDSGREGEYIYRLVEQEAHVQGKKRLRVWIDSQTEEEILHGIATAKDLSAYDNLASAAYLRAKEDYLMGINFSRLLSLKYGQSISSCMGTRYTVISVGRVMTCVLGMIVRREREIRQFVKMPFYRVLSSMVCGESTIEGEFRAVKGSAYFQSPKLYKENGFSHKEDAKELIEKLSDPKPVQAVIEKLERKKENKNPPLLQIGTGGILGLVAAMILEPHPAAMSGMNIGSIAYLAVFCTVVPYLLSVFGQKYVKTSTSGVILSFESVFGCLLSILVLEERPGMRFVIGAVLMMCSFLIVEKISLPSPKRVAVKAEK